ncbi:uncharacterized protein LOC110709211 [Chenopodium quinoa]|uniref:uncharacterized protein LOC110709211 n=1 Tax=Chenopodium quinoa TaxID=63459 RepID=UPI000B796A57|nr:uncharacterized protein LOC110709211 [Chenopodium quinoa]
MWRIAHKKESLWVKWVHSVYLKHQDWWTYQPKKSAGWAWKKLCKIRDDLRLGFEEKGWLQQSYKISETYKWLQGDLPKVEWAAWIWNRYTSPKHAFISWLAIHNRLKTRAKLEKFGVCEDSSCLLCGTAIESRDHLLFYCTYNRKCMTKIARLLGITEAHYNIEATWIHWRRKLTDHVQRKVGLAALTSVVYHLWFARIHVFWHKAVVHPNTLFKGICTETKDRVIQLISCKWTRKHCKLLFRISSTRPN